jgi:anaerobic ribonucleoside-triphosphate reductase activating protein
MVQQSNDPGCRHRSDLNLAGFLARSTVNGPGIRSVVWVQGCSLHCNGCFNTSSWSFSPNYQLSPGELADQIIGLDGIDGVTFSGGEPFAQAALLAVVGRRVQEEGLTVLTYTGFTAHQLFRKQRRSWNELLEVTDILVAGPYIEGYLPVFPLTGSGNQQVIPLTNAIPLSTTILPAPPTRFEYIISPDGCVTTTGFPDLQHLQRLVAQCRGE